ncbi:MAG: hypothetical protein FWC54_03545 [Actinomycetia bacterium]|nr:hypothetical protein [Actinomycetes bacterium]
MRTEKRGLLFLRRLLSVVVALTIGVAPMAPLTAGALTGEGAISYLKPGTTEVNPGGPDIAAFVDAYNNHISGSKAASPLDANDQSKVTISVPSGETKPAYDIVVLTDASASGSFAPMTAASQKFLNDLAQNVVGPQGAADVNLGMVSFGTVAYDQFTAPSSGAAASIWDLFTQAVQQGELSTIADMLPAGSVPASYLPLINELKAVPDFSAASLAGPYAQSYSYLLGDTTAGLKPLSASASPADPTSAAALYNEAAVNGSRQALVSLLANAQVVADNGISSGLYTTLGYTMSNAVIGTNLEAGIKAAQRLLATGSAAPENKYLVILTDGGAYYWDGAAGNVAPENSLTNVIHNQGANKLSWGQISYDYYKTPAMTALSYADFASFLAGTDVLTSTQSQMTLGDWQAYHANASAYPNIAQIATSYNNNPVGYPYAAIEKGTAHAAAALKAVADSKAANIVMMGSDYNPSYPQPSEVAALFRDYAKTLTSSYYAVNAATEEADVEGAFSDIVSKLEYSIASATLTDTIGPDFDLVLAGATLAPSDITLSVGGTNLAGVIDPGNANRILFGAADAQSGRYPYTVTYTPGSAEQVLLTINVPVKAAEGLKLSYTLKLMRQTNPTGWHTNVALNTGAVLNYKDSAGNAGSATFPVPVTTYYVSPVTTDQLTGHDFSYPGNTKELTADQAKKLAGVTVTDADGQPIDLSQVTVDEDQLAAINAAVKANKAGSFPLTFVAPDGTEMTITVTVTHSQSPTPGSKGTTMTPTTPPKGGRLPTTGDAVSVITPLVFLAIALLVVLLASQERLRRAEG